MISEIEQEFCRYLKENIAQFIEEWQKNIIVSEDDPFQDEIIENGEKLILLLISLIMEEIEIEDIKSVCDKVAAERVQAEVNIGDFVYNTNRGRNMLFEMLCKRDVKAVELLPVIDKIHGFFDYLTYYTVLRYSSIIAENLEKQEKYINETHKERLTILGQMSASFVHEFRNPLTSIMGFVKLLRSEHPQIQYLDIISHEIEQLNFRISQFLLVSRKETNEQPENFSVNELFLEIIHFLYPSVVNINVNIEKNMVQSIMMNGHRSEIRQVFLNILMNSIDALESMPNDRKIVIETKEDEKFINIVIKNNGPSIDKNQIETIFEPFVTTKKLGTGIGLYVCKQIVEKHNGSITCDSTPAWTSFHITFHKQAAGIVVRTKQYV